MDLGRGLGESEREREGETKTFAQLVLVIPVSATACMSAYLLFCGFGSKCKSLFDLQCLLFI